MVGLAVTTLGVLGIYRMPDVYTQVHAAGKVVFLGIVAFLLAAVASLDATVAARCALIGVFLLLTTPVGAHVIARAAYRRDEPMHSPHAVDESGHDLAGVPREPAAERPGG